MKQLEQDIGDDVIMVMFTLSELTLLSLSLIILPPSLMLTIQRLQVNPGARMMGQQAGRCKQGLGEDHE
jgi:hypothetical protein